MLDKFRPTLSRGIFLEFKQADLARIFLVFIDSNIVYQIGKLVFW